MPNSPEYYASLVKAGPGLNTESAKKAEELVKIQSFGQALEQADLSNERYFAQQRREDQELSNSINSILSINAGLDAKPEPSFGQVLLAGAELDAMGKQEALLSSLSDLPNLSKDSGIVSATAAFKTAIQGGSSKEINQALGDLKNSFNSALPRLDDAGKNKLSRDYKKLVELANTQATIKASAQDLEEYLGSKDLTTRTQELGKFNQDNSRLSYALKSPDKKNSDVVNELADLESNVYGSRLYNTEDLTVFKNTYVKTDDDLYAKFDMSYAAAKQYAVQNKLQNYQQQVAAIDKQIAEAVDQNQKNQLALTKANLNNEIAYLGQVNDKLKAESTPDIYLKKFYPEVYAKEKHRQALEMVKNRNFAAGDEIQWFGENGIFVGGAQAIKKNALNQVAGLAHLVGSNETGYRIRSGANLAAPPTLFLGADINKNNKIDQHEITRDIYGDAISFDQAKFEYKDENGKTVTNWNLQAPIEATLPIAFDVATTVLLTRGVGAAARGAGLTYSRVGSAVGMAESLPKLAPAISTFGSVTSTTFPRFYAEERANFKDDGDAMSVAIMRATVEGLTETIVPDSSFFKGSKQIGYLDKYIDPALDAISDGLSRIPGIGRMSFMADQLLTLVPPGSLSKLDALKIVAPTALRKTLSGATQETVEELASLVGNYFVDNYAAQPNNFEYEKQNELTWDSFQETLVEGFIPSLFISGFQVNAPTKVKQFDQFNNPIKDSNGKQVERWQYMPYVQRLEQARWNVATNPELYKQLAARDRAAGKITREQEIKQVAKIQQLATKFESMSDDLNNIKDLYGLAVDRERQYSYFNNLLHQEDLLGTDTSNFTAEELAEYENMTAQVTNEVLSTRKLISQTKALTEQEKQTNLKRVFEQRKDKLGEISMAEMLQLAHSLNPVIANLNKKQTPEFDFLKENYNDFYNSVIANLTDRVTNFINQAETNPESLTNLDLQTFAEVFGFPLANLSSLEGPMPEMLSEGAQGVTVPFMPTKPLVDRVKTLLTERSVYLNPEVFVASASKNLQNLELKSIQQSRMALAQLTPEEIESGEVNAALHPNLSKTQIFNLGIELQKNKQRVAKDGKDTLTNRVNQIRNNDYYFAKNDDGTYDLGMIQSANVQAAEAAKSQPVNTAFQGSASQQAQAEAEAKRQAEEQARQEAEAAAAAQAGAPVEVDPESPLGEEIESQDEEVELHPVNVDLYNQYAALVVELNRTLNNSDLDPEERSQIISTFRSQLLADIKDQSDLTNIYSILVAAFPGNEAKITDFINKAEQGQLDTSLILGLPNGPANSFVNQVGKHIASIINGEVSKTPTETPTEAATPTVEPELVIDEEPTDVPEHNDQEVGQSLLSLQLEEGPFSLSLSMTSVDQNNKSLMDDPHVAFAQRILAVYSEKRGAQPAYKAYMASAMNIYRKLLPDSIETLERLQKLNRKLTADEEALLRAALQVKGIPLHNKEFINYLVANPSKIGSGILSLVVDNNLNPVYFRENGLEGSIDDVPLLISLKTKNHLNVNAAELALRNTIEAQGNSGFVTADIIGISSSKQLSVSGLKNAKVYVHFEATPEEYATPFGKFTLNPGYTYVQIPGDPYQYQPVKLPQASPDFLIKLVEAFNNGILPTGFPSEIYESAEAFKSYLENLFYFNADTQGLILGSTRGGKLVFKKKNKNGKYQAITGSEDVQLETIRSAFQDLRYMVSKNSLSSKQPQILLYEQNGIRLKEFPNYEALVLSPEFGAKVVMRANASFALSPELTIENTISNAEKGFETVVPAFPIVSDVPGVEVESSTEDPTVEVGQKQIKRGLQALKEATSEKEIAQAIINLEKNIKGGGKLTKEQQDFVNQKRQELKDKGFEIVDYTGEIWDEGMNIEVNFIDLEEGTNLTQEQIDAVEKELEKRKKSIEKLIELGLSEEDARSRQRGDFSIMTTIQPQLNKDGKMVQVAKVTALQIKASEAEEILERSKKNPRNIQKERIDRITAKSNADARAALEQPKSTEGRQLSLLEDQPRLTPEEIAEREAEQKAEREEEARQRETDRQNAIADEELYMEYQMEKEAFESLELTPVAQALSEMRVTQDSFEKFGDKNSLKGRGKGEGGRIARSYFKVGGFGVDQVAMRATDLNGGVEVTTDEIIEFMTRYPAGVGNSQSTSISTYYGSFNPKYDSKYNSIQDLIKQKEKEARRQKRQGKEIAQDEFSVDNVEERDPWDIDPFTPRDSSPFDEFFRAIELENEITEAQNKAAEDWVNSHPIFKNTKFIFNKTLHHPLAYATWSKAAITLYADANYAEAYHEAWHEFSQMYLTPSQRQSLYAEARKIYGDLPLVELEEKLAESFRQFALSNGTQMPQEIADYEDSKNIFQKMWDFLTGFFTDKLTVDKYFSQLYKGNISSYTRNEDSGYFKTLYSSKLVLKHPDNEDKVFSFRDSQKILTQMDSLFVDIANKLGQPYGATFVNVVENPKLTTAVLQEMNKVIAEASKQYGAKVAENPTPAATSKFNYTSLLSSNANTLLTFFKSNSSLFNDKVRRVAIEETIENEQETGPLKEFSRLETSIDEMSQKTTAHPLIISAIKSLPMYKNRRPVKDTVFGMNTLGSFDLNWNSLQRTLSGSNSYEQLYARLTQLAKEQLQFRPLLEYLPKPAQRNVKQSTLNFKNLFYNTFAMPYIDGYISEIRIVEDENANSFVDFQIYKAQTSDVLNLSKVWDNVFVSSPSLYKLVDPDTGSYYLNTDKYFADYQIPAIPAGATVTEEALNTYKQQLLELLEPLGFNFTELAKQTILTRSAKELQSDVKLIYNKIKSYAESEETGPIYKPMEVLRTAHKNTDGSTSGSEVRSTYKLIGAEIKVNVEYANDMRYNALNKKVWSVTPHTYMTRIVSALNDAERFPTLQSLFSSYPQLNDQYNEGGSYSLILSYLFDAAGNRRTEDDGTYRVAEIASLFGIKTEDNATKTVDSTEALKHFTEIQGFIKRGVEELNRLSGKSTTRSLVMPTSLMKELGFDNAAFDTPGKIVIPDSVIYQLVLANVYSEVQVAKRHVDSPNPFFRVSPFLDKENTKPRLTYFENIFDEATRIELYNHFANVPKESLGASLGQIQPELLAKVKQQYAQYIANNVKVSRNILTNAFDSNTVTVSTGDLTRYHVFSMFSRIEQHKLFFGHPYYYKADKDIEKRLSAWNAYGNYAVLDEQNIQEISKTGFTQRKAFLEHNNALGENKVEVNPDLNTDLNKISYLVLQDTIVDSETAKNSAAYQTRVPNLATGETVPLSSYYVNNTDAKKQDAAAFATLDFYANFYSMSTGVTLDMKKEFDRQNRIYGLYLQSQRGENVQAELEKALNEGPYYTFTIKKLQYAGHNLTQDKTIPVFHKYSVKPILPSEIIGDPNLALILQKLHASSADYAVFSSGTKIAETVEPISLFNTDGSVNANYVPSSVGKVDTQYLKEQVLIENKETFMSIFSTQFRKLLFKDSPVESEALYDQYREAIESLVDFDKIKFLSKIEDQEKLVSFIVSELSKKNIAEGTKDLIQLKENGELKYVLDAFVDRTIMESTMIASLKNAIIKQKVPGAQRVQYPVSLIRPGRKLRYYDLVDGKVTKAETIVSFSKGYYPLLNLQYNGKPIGEFNEFGQPINLFSAVQRLNEALNNPLFRSKYADILDKALTIAAIRVPGQDYNSMENFQIVEFLPQESGEIILVPDEMVIKSGSDFDIDKLFCYDPYLESDGSVRTNTLTGEDAFDYEEELREELADNKLILKETLRERNGLAAQVAQIIEKYGFDSNTIRLKELYAKLKAADTVTEDEQEIEEMDRTTLAERMRERMLGGSGTITKKSQEINNETKRIRKALFEAREEGLSDAINALSNQINDLNSRNKFLTNEIKAIRGRMSNSLLLTISERLSQQDVFDKLLRPNSSDVVKKLANEFGIQSEWTKASYTNIINPIYQLYVHRLNSFKKALGQDAKMNVLFAILQKAGLKVIDKKAVAAYPLNANGKKDGVLDFSQSNGVDGTRIGDLTGQLITAHVDIEKHDEVAWINLNVRINPVTNYMVGVGSSFRDIVKFVNLGYTAAGAKTPSTSSIVLYGRGNSRMNDSEFIQSILDGIYEKSNKWANENQTILPEVQLLSNSVTKFNTFGLGSLKAQVAKIIEANPEIILNDTTGYGNLVRFISFLSVKDQQSKLFTLSSNTDFDTFSPQNFEAFRKGANELRLLMKENFFNQDAIKRVISESVVSPFQIQADIFETFEKIFPISANAELGTLITTAFTSVKKSNPSLEYDQFSRVLKNDLLYALFRNNVSQVAEMENLLDKRNPGNIVAIYENLKARLFERKITSDNLIFDGVSFATEETSAFIRTGFSSVDAEDSVNVLREEFEMGLNWAHPDLDPNNEDDAELQKDMQSFFLAYAYAGIIGSQLNKKYDSYLPYIPETVYTTRMPSIIKNFAEEMTNTLEQVNKAIYDFVSADNSAEILKESKEYLIADATDYTEVVNDIVQDKLYQLLSGSNTFAAKFLKRFLQNHPEFQGKYGTNRDLIYFKDYDLSRESITPTMKNEVPTTEVSSPRKYTPKEVLKLEPNQVFVFGANTVGHHGAGGAGYAMFGNGAANYTVYPKGAKGKWAEYGVVNQLMEGSEGKSFGIITKFASVETNDKGEPAVRIGAKRSVDLSVVEDSIVAMLQTAQQNPELEFLVSEIGIKLAGWNPGHIKTIFAKNINLIGDNVVLPKVFEVRDSKGRPSMVTVANTIDLEVKPENYEAIRQEAIKASFNELSEQSEAFKNFCKGVS
jgi:hypothetical protein